MTNAALTPEQIDLKPCPFCGKGDARPFVAHDEYGRDSHGVQCTGFQCSICGPERGTVEEASEAWNYRPLPSGGEVQPIPAGWKLVPIEPNSAMMQEGAVGVSVGNNDLFSAACCYRNMLAAAPSLPSVSEPVAGELPQDVRKALHERDDLYRAQHRLRADVVDMFAIFERMEHGKFSNVLDQEKYENLKIRHAEWNGDILSPSPVDVRGDTPLCWIDGDSLPLERDWSHLEVFNDPDVTPTNLIPIFLHPPTASPQPADAGWRDKGVTVSRDDLARIMREEWDEICQDTECHPLDITHGKKTALFFEPGHWVTAIADRLSAALQVSNG